MSTRPPSKGLVIGCIDGRLWPHHTDNIVALKAHAPDETQINVILSGGATAKILCQGIEADMLADIQLSYDMGIRDIYIYEHQDCLMYASLANAGDTRFAVTDETEQAVHDANSLAAEKILTQQFPDLRIYRHYQTIDGKCIKLGV